MLAAVIFRGSVFRPILASLQAFSQALSNRFLTQQRQSAVKKSTKAELVRLTVIRNPQESQFIFIIKKNGMGNAL
jgi:hypothetical protein